MKRFILTGLLCLVPLSANAISAEFMEGQFEPVLDIGNVTSIEAWEQPRTQYTPKNLKSEYQIRYNGTDASGRGAYSYTTHFTDYDTYITKNGITEDGKYYVQDNTGKGFVTGEHVDLEPINQQLDTVNNQITNVSNNVTNIGKTVATQQQQLNTVNNNMQNIKAGMNSLKDGLYKLNSRMEHGLATVTALTGLHPNPRSRDKLEITTAVGMYQDNVAGAIGLFYHPNDRVQLSIGAAYGGQDSWAGNVGVTFSIGGRRKK